VLNAEAIFHTSSNARLIKIQLFLNKARRNANLQPTNRLMRKKVLRAYLSRGDKIAQSIVFSPHKVLFDLKAEANIFKGATIAPRGAHISA
jgi:hypothetical protein